MIAPFCRRLIISSCTREVCGGDGTGGGDWFAKDGLTVLFCNPVWSLTFPKILSWGVVLPLSEVLYQILKITSISPKRLAYTILSFPLSFCLDFSLVLSFVGCSDI